ncbi:MAG: hypothetical protein V4820_17485 [Pseudomonadota bacterium]
MAGSWLERRAGWPVLLGAMLGVGVSNSLFGDVNGAFVKSPAAGLAMGRPAQPVPHPIFEPAVTR